MLNRGLGGTCRVYQPELNRGGALAPQGLNCILQALPAQSILGQVKTSHQENWDLLEWGTPLCWDGCLSRGW